VNGSLVFFVAAKKVTHMCFFIRVITDPFDGFTGTVCRDVYQCLVATVEYTGAVDGIIKIVADCDLRKLCMVAANVIGQKKMIVPQVITEKLCIGSIINIAKRRTTMIEA
jgi:hypothetical protein